MPCPVGFASKGCSLLRDVGTSILELWDVKQPMPPSSLRGSGGEAVASAEPGERCSLLLLKSQPKGSVFAQLLVASSGLLLISQDSTWHAWEPILEKEQAGLAC